tara:strand:+ start:302 stop:1018 length:717 start_codon:yes stop_codon:yes gene_type:complete
MASSALDFINRYGGNAATLQSGQTALHKGLAGGLTYDNIGSLGINFGPEAAKELNKYRGTFIGKYGGKQGSTGLGALDRALAGNAMTIQQILQRQQQEGFTFGPAAQAKVDQYKDSFTGKFGGSVDQSATGLTAVMRGMNSGMSVDDIIGTGLQFGPKAQEFLSAMKIPVPEMPPMPDIKIPSPMNITPSYLGNSGNADGVAVKRSEKSKRRASNQGTYQFNRKNYSPNSSLLGINLK